MCVFFSKSSRYLESVNPVANLLRISAVPQFSRFRPRSIRFMKCFILALNSQCRLLHTFFSGQFQISNSIFKFQFKFQKSTYKFHISAQISNFRTKFLVPSTKFHRVIDPSITFVARTMETRGPSIVLKTHRGYDTFINHVRSNRNHLINLQKSEITLLKSQRL